jgi:hypothetical protein
MPPGLEARLTIAFGFLAVCYLVHTLSTRQ